MHIFLSILSEYKYPISKWLIDNGAESVLIPVLDYYRDKKTPDQEDQRIRLLDLDRLIDRRFADKQSLNDLPALDDVFLQELKRYEPDGIHLNTVQWTWPTGIYDEARRLFYAYLRYWNNYFDKHETDCIIFDVVPHWPVFYALYSVAKIRKIRILIIQAFGIRVPETKGYICVLGDDIQNLGCSVEQYYVRMGQMDPLEIELTGLIKAYFDRSVNHASEAALKPNDRKAWKKYVRVNKYAGTDVHIPFFQYLAHNIKYFMGAAFKYHDIGRYNEKKYDIKDLAELKRSRIYTKYDAYSLKEYEKMASNPDYDVKYVYFPLQLWPEASTLPQAGLFDDQISTVFLLSRIVRRFGIKVYVKEYYLQPYRAKSFYDDIRKLDNVVLIHSSVSSDELLRHAVAAASQTGTVLIEAPFYGIPALTFGSGFGLRGMPGLYRIKSEQQGCEVMETILNGVEISLDELKRYYYALQQNSVFFHRTPNGRVDVGSPEYEETVRDLKRVLQSEVLSR